jgi:nitroreductase
MDFDNGPMADPQSTRAIDLLDPKELARDSQGVFRAIYERRAIRVYSGESVSRSQVDALVDAAIHAPSAVNAQPWAFVVVQDDGLLHRYAEEAKALLLAEPAPPEVTNSGLPELDRLRQMVSEPGYALFHGAGTLIVIYATSGAGVPDCFLAAQNLMLAAWALGLGTCPIGLATPLFNREAIKKELGIPSEWTAALPIVVGHPAGKFPPTSRRPAVLTSR